jgi:hypothetical protein
MIKRSLNYYTAKYLRNFFCGPITLPGGCICLLVSCCQRYSSFAATNGEDFGSCTEYLYFSGDRLKKRCKIIVDGAQELLKDYQRGQELREIDTLTVHLSSLLNNRLCDVLNELDILDISSQEKDLHRLRLIGEALATKIIAKLPKDLQTTAAQAKISLGTPHAYGSYFNNTFYALVTREFVKTELQACYDNAMTELRRESKEEQRKKSADRITETELNFFAYTPPSPVARLTSIREESLRPG